MRLCGMIEVGSMGCVTVLQVFSNEETSYLWSEFRRVLIMTVILAVLECQLWEQSFLIYNKRGKYIFFFGVGTYGWRNKLCRAGKCGCVFKDVSATNWEGVRHLQMFYAVCVHHSCVVPHSTKAQPLSVASHLGLFPPTLWPEDLEVIAVSKC